MSFGEDLHKQEPTHLCPKKAEVIVKKRQKIQIINQERVKGKVGGKKYASPLRQEQVGGKKYAPTSKRQKTQIKEKEIASQK